MHMGENGQRLPCVENSFAIKAIMYAVRAIVFVEIPVQESQVALVAVYCCVVLWENIQVHLIPL